MGRHLPTCEVVIEQLSRSMDTSLPLTTLVKLKLHLIMCRLCRAYGDQIVLVRQAARVAADQSHLEPKTLSPAAKERLKNKLRDESDSQ